MKPTERPRRALASQQRMGRDPITSRSLMVDRAPKPLMTRWSWTVSPWDRVPTRVTTISPPSRTKVLPQGSNQGRDSDPDQLGHCHGASVSDLLFQKIEYRVYRLESTGSRDSSPTPKRRAPELLTSTPQNWAECGLNKWVGHSAMN